MTEQLPDVQHRPDPVAATPRGIAEPTVAIRTALAKAGLLITGSALAAVSLSLQPRADDATAAAVESRDDDVHVTLDDLASDAVALLNEADGVARVERLVSVPKPQHRIIHIVLGGDHDLSTHVRAIPGCEYLRVFVKGFPATE